MMNFAPILTVAVIGALAAGTPAAVFLAATADGAPKTQEMSRGMPGMMKPDMAAVEAVIGKWMEEPKMTAKTVMGKYGMPDEMTATRLIWMKNGPWKWTMLENVEIPHEFPMMHHDMLQQAIDYKIMPSMADELSAYDGSVILDRTRGEISARCDKEEANFLAINLAHDVMMKKRNVKGARSFYGDTIKQMKAMSLDMTHRPYTEGFTFMKPMGMTNDPDRPLMMGGGR